MEQIGKYQFRRVLGKGASGTVYLALDTFSGADVALKVLDPHEVRRRASLANDRFRPQAVARV